MKSVSIVIPPDKSISHRAVMLASISKGSTRIKNILMAEDIKRTIEAFRAMGVKISIYRHVTQVDVVVRGVGMVGLKKPAKPLYLGNSGTTMRILPGILAGQDFEVVLEGDESLSKRPMQRITVPLKKMGVKIEGHREENIERRAEEIKPPLKIRGGKLKAIKYNSKIASAQVKSCILLAGLFADGITHVTEPEKSRDHTERMLAMFGCKVRDEGLKVSLKGPVCLRSPGVIEIPGDISSAAFFIVAGCISPGAKIIIKNVGLNPTRIGILDILKKMGANVSLKFKVTPRLLSGQESLKLEPVGDIVVKSSRFKGIAISPKEVVRAIDEIPVIMVAACFAKGRTIIKGIQELRVKETDRVESMVTNLRKIGADIKVKGELIVINGGKLLTSASVSSFGDHRTAMSMMVAGLGAKGKVIVTDLDCINKSFPNFLDILNKLN
ncbi:MAG: 3-phosphoshikimate 1-carboxyvinyltransferase [Candidatus Omnitrophica bacterium]|nr:3-phosphoshikimate 1-carboxyvinyltransferase [Candidatus Omnitrophota bacterium]